MLASFTGAQCTGKTTLLYKMLNDSDFRKCSFIKEVTRKVARHGLSINELGTNETQLFILSEHLSNHHLKGCNILDRCILDGWIYTEYLYEQGQVDKWILDYSWNLLKILSTKIDIIFYTDPADVKLVNDNIRSACEKFRQSIISKYDALLFSSEVNDKCIDNIRSKTVVLSGTVDERYKTIVNTFKNYDTTR